MSELSRDASSNPASERRLEGRRILVFDVNESLLDVSALEQSFMQLFGVRDALKTWFNLLLQYSNVATLTNDYHPFGELGLAAVATTASIYGVSVDHEQAQTLVEGLLALPPHPEVKAALERLRGAGFHMVTLTNSAPSAAESQLRAAALLPLFDHVYTVEPVELFKPHRSTYEFVASELNVSTADLRMIAAHGWDIAGALAAGCAGAFIARRGQALYPLAPRPDVIGPDLKVVTDIILRVERPD